jgi:butyrate kinase
MCYSDRYTKKDMIRFVRGGGRLKALLGTSDGHEIEKMVLSGNGKARLLYEAQAYQIAKGIGEMAPVLSGKCDGVILTGGLARSKMLTDMIAERVGFIAHVEIIPEAKQACRAVGATRTQKRPPAAIADGPCLLTFY